MPSHRKAEKAGSKSLKALLNKDTLSVARGLIGRRLITDIRGIESSGIIVETEAYGGPIDEAAHSFIGKTARNSEMFEKAGHCYVYFIYGMHYCVNVVTEPKGTAAAVLIRALEPFSGIPAMQKRRGVSKVRELCSGPAKLCQALSIDRRMLGEDLLNSKLIRIEDPPLDLPTLNIISTERIGISKSSELKWRFCLRGSPFLSR